MSQEKKIRAFKTAWFSKYASRAAISDKELCDAVKELNQRQWDADLGGNVFKKRLNKNMHRSIVITKTDEYWFFTYAFAKADRKNISNKELAGFKKLAKNMSCNTDDSIKKMIEDDELVEICNEKS